MSPRKTTPKTHEDERLREELGYLKLTSILQNYLPLATQAATEGWSHLDFLCRLIEAEAGLRQDRSGRRQLDFPADDN